MEHKRESSIILCSWPPSVNDGSRLAPNLLTGFADLASYLFAVKGGTHGEFSFHVNSFCVT